MNTSNIHTVGILALTVLLVGSVGFAAEPVSTTIMDFSNAATARKWVSVNDNVMGGVSDGGFRITDDEVLVFSGNLSLKNRGGFASIRTKPAKLGLGGYDTIALRVRGDGRTYYFDLRTPALFAATSYRVPLKTTKGAWQEVRFPLKDFEYTSFGRRVARGGKLQADKVQSIGFTVADKREGPFRLEVQWIRGEKSDGANGPTASRGRVKRAGAKDIVDTAVAAGKFNTLVAAVKAAGLVEALKGKGPLTVFAPTDDAFAKLPKGTVASLLEPENRDKLTAILTYHVVGGEILLGSRSLSTLEGRELAIKSRGGFEVNGVKILATDILASNGVIHVIDAVLLPPAKKLTPAEAARSVIELAIKRGVPVFNAGQHSACAAIYEVAVESLLQSHTKALSDKDRSALSAALKKMRKEKDAPEQAWILRRALDKVYQSLAAK